MYAPECAFPAIQVGLDTGRMKAADFYRELGSGTAITAWAVTKQYSASHPEVVRAFARAWRESSNYTNAHHSATVDMMAAFTAVPAEVIAKMPRATATPTRRPDRPEHPCLVRGFFEQTCDAAGNARNGILVDVRLPKLPVR